MEHVYTSRLWIVIVLLAACSGETADRPLGPADQVAASSSADGDSDSDSETDGDSDSDDELQFGPWSEPVNLGPSVNSEFADFAPTISRDGLSLYFGSARPGDPGVTDIYLSRRSTRKAEWGPAENVGAPLNVAGPVIDNGAFPTPDGRALYFQSNRPGGHGNLDIYVSRRRNARSAWGDPINLGATINTGFNEGGASYFVDPTTKIATLYFQSNRLGSNDIYASVVGRDGSLGTPVLVEELNSTGDDQRITIRRDGLQLYMSSNRTGTLGGLDLWVSTRASTRDPWSAPQNLGHTVNTIHNDAGPSLSHDGRTLYFHAVRPGTIGPTPAFDIWTMTRQRIRQRDDD